MKKLTKIIAIMIFISMISVSLCLAGVVGNSDYDKIWTIIVTNCSGSATVYHGCVLVNQGEDWVSFIPDQGRIPTGNGKVIKVSNSMCSQIIMEEEK